MSAKPSNNKIRVDIELYAIRWYPSDRGDVNPNRPRTRPRQIPPLMVRKAEWRR
ncbi:MAG: hypothetical protein ACYTBJ_11145 [Planctomycetota bacterium]